MLIKCGILRHFQRTSFIPTNNTGSWTDGVFPRECFTKTFVRSSGPGGQNVNKIATKCEIRFNVNEAHWLENDILECFIERERNRINKLGEFSIASDKTRHAEKNEDDCYDKLKMILSECAKQVAWENRVPTEKDIEVLNKQAKDAESRRRVAKERLKKKKQLRSKDFF